MVLIATFGSRIIISMVGSIFYILDALKKAEYRQPGKGLFKGFFYEKIHSDLQ